MSRPHQKKSLKLYSTQYGHVKIVLDCLGSVKKVPRYTCYKFQLYISKRAPTSIRLILAHVYRIKNRTHVAAKKIFFTEKIQIINELNRWINFCREKTNCAIFSSSEIVFEKLWIWSNFVFIYSVFSTRFLHFRKTFGHFYGKGLWNVKQHQTLILNLQSFKCKYDSTKSIWRNARIQIYAVYTV